LNLIPLFLQMVKPSEIIQEKLRVCLKLKI
jgi:hypothetical protein